MKLSNSAVPKHCCMLQKNRLCGKPKSQTGTVYIYYFRHNNGVSDCFCYLQGTDDSRLINYLTMYCILKVAEEEVDLKKTGRTNCNLKQSWNIIVRIIHVDDNDDKEGADRGGHWLL